MGEAEGSWDGDRVTIHPYVMRDLEEVLGDLHSVERTDAGIIALIGKIPVLLPSELAEKLRGLIGRRVGVIRIEGCYRARAL